MSLTVAGLRGASLIGVVLLLVSCGSTDRAVEDPLVSPEYLSRMSESLSDYYGIEDPPAVDVVRAVAPEELDEVMRSCVGEAGFPIGPDGTVHVPQSQQEAHALAQYTCAMRYPTIEKYAQPWGEEQIALQYEWTSEVVVPCLEAEGFSIVDVPSRQAFIDTWESDPFYPFAQIDLDATDAAGYNARMSRLEKSCPQIAPAEVIWDGTSLEAWLARNGAGVAP